MILKGLCESVRVGNEAPAVHKKGVITDFFLRTVRIGAFSQGNAYLDNRFTECATRALSEIDATRSLELLFLVTDGVARLLKGAPVPRTVDSVPEEKRLASLILLVGDFHEAEDCARAVACEGGNMSEKAIRETAAWGEAMRKDVSMRNVFASHVVM